jgi:hypothetical protein
MGILHGTHYEIRLGYMPRIPFQKNDIISNITLDSLFSFRKKIFLENFNISENNIIRVELTQVLP